MALSEKTISINAPTRVYLGANAFTLLPEVVMSIDASPRVFLITKKNIRNQQMVNVVREMIEEDVYDILVHENGANSITEDILLKVSIVARQARANVIIAMGGETEMLLAKLVSFHIHNPVSLESVDSFSTYKKVPLLAVPTEPVAHEGVIPRAFYFTPSDEMRAIENSCFIADYMILDPELTLSLPPNYTATTAMDLLTLSVELALGATQNEMIKMYIDTGTTLLGNNMANVVLDGGRVEYRRAVLLASLLFGYALAQSYRGSLFAVARSLSHVSGKYSGIINTILLPHIMDYNFATFPEQFVSIARSFKENVADITMVEAAIKAVEMVRRMIDSFQMPSQLSSINIKKTALRDAVKSAFRFDGVERAAKPMERTEMVNILENAF